MKDQSHLKILLMQIREDAETRNEEMAEFVRFSGLKREQFTSLDVFKEADFLPEVIQGFDALFVGGSSDATVLDLVRYPFVSNCKALLRYCYDHNVPVFASCFGFQVAVEEFGGKVISDPEHMEMGIYDIVLSELGKNDRLFKNIPDVFKAVSGHKERAALVPKNCDVLGRSRLCPYHIIKFQNKPFYGFQFHPEVPRDDLIARISRYQDRYLDGIEHLEQVIESSTSDTHYANQIIGEFVKIIL